MRLLKVLLHADSYLLSEHVDPTSDNCLFIVQLITQQHDEDKYYKSIICYNNSCFKATVVHPMMLLLTDLRIKVDFLILLTVGIIYKYIISPHHFCCIGMIGLQKHSDRIA